MNNPREGKIGDGGSRRRGKGGEGVEMLGREEGGEGSMDEERRRREMRRDEEGGEEVNEDEQAQKNRKSGNGEGRRTHRRGSI